MLDRRRGRKPGRLWSNHHSRPSLLQLDVKKMQPGGSVKQRWQPPCRMHEVNPYVNSAQIICRNGPTVCSTDRCIAIRFAFVLLPRRRTSSRRTLNCRSFSHNNGFFPRSAAWTDGKEYSSEYSEHISQVVDRIDEVALVTLRLSRQWNGSRAETSTMAWTDNRDNYFASPVFLFPKEAVAFRSLTHMKMRQG